MGETCQGRGCGDAHLLSAQQDGSPQQQCMHRFPRERIILRNRRTTLQSNLMEELDDVSSLERVGLIVSKLQVGVDHQRGCAEGEGYFMAIGVRVAVFVGQVAGVEILAGDLNALDDDLIGHADVVALSTHLELGHEAEP